MNISQKYLLIAFLSIKTSCTFSQTPFKLNSWNFGSGLSFVKESQLKKGVSFNTGIALQVSSKLNAIINLEYMFANDIKQDDRYLNIYNLNKSLSYVHVDAGVERTLFKTGSLNFAVSTSLALRKRNEAFASVFYKQFPLEQTPRLVSETVYSSMWQLGDITSLKARFNLKKMFVGINGNYQLFSKNSFLSSGVFTGINF